MGDPTFQLLDPNITRVTLSTSVVQTVGRSHTAFVQDSRPETQLGSTDSTGDAVLSISGNSRILQNLPAEDIAAVERDR